MFTVTQKSPQCKYNYDQLFHKCCLLTTKLKEARLTAESMYRQLEVARKELVEARGALEDCDRMLATEQTSRRELQREVYGLRKRKRTDGDSDFRKKVKNLLSKVHTDRTGTHTQFSSTEVTQLVTELL